MDLHRSRPHSTTCPWCGKDNDRATGFSEGAVTPSDGDLSLCIGCGEWSVFDSSASIGCRKPTDSELAEIATNSDCQRAREAFVAALGFHRV